MPAMGKNWWDYPEVNLLANSGTQTAGLAEENGGRQNVTFTVGPGQAFLVPQGGICDTARAAPHQ